MEDLEVFSVERGEGKGEWVSVGEAARLLGVAPSTVRVWGDKGLLPGVRTPGGHRRFRREGLKSFLEGPPLSFPPSWGSLSEEALRRIRRRLDRAGEVGLPWSTALDEEGRARLRLYGRRLLEVAMAFLLQERSRPRWLEEVRLLGQEHGRELARRGLPLSEGVAAFLFFHRSLREAVREALQGPLRGKEPLRLWERVDSLLGEFFLALATAYESGRGREARPAGG